MTKLENATLEQLYEEIEKRLIEESLIEEKKVFDTLTQPLTKREAMKIRRLGKPRLTIIK